MQSKKYDIVRTVPISINRQIIETESMYISLTHEPSLSWLGMEWFISIQ